MRWFGWEPLPFLGYLGKDVYHTYSKKGEGVSQYPIKYIYSTDRSANPGSEFAFDVRELENPLGLDIESPWEQMRLVACAIEKGKIRFPEEQNQKPVDLQDPMIRTERKMILLLIAQEEKIKAEGGINDSSTSSKVLSEADLVRC